MADDEKEKVEASLDEDIEGEEEDNKKSSNMMIIIIAVVLLLAGGGAGAYFMGFIDPLLGSSEVSEEEGNEGEKKAEKHGEEKGEKGSGPYFLAMPDQRVNLNSEGGPPTFLQLKVQLELSSEEDKTSLEAVMPRVIDQFQTYLRELRVRDLKGSAGIYRLQTELLNRVNSAAAPVEVKDVLFQEILIQEN